MCAGPRAEAAPGYSPPPRWGENQAGAELRYRFNTLKLWDWRDRIDDLEAMPGFIGSAVLAHLQSILTKDAPVDRFAWKWRLMRRLYNKGHAPEAIRRAFGIIDWFLALPVELERQLSQRVNDFEKGNAVPYVPSWERIAKEDGVLEGLRRSAASALRAKFRDAGQQFADTELATANETTLEKVIPAVFAVNTLDELRAAIFS